MFKRDSAMTRNIINLDKSDCDSVDSAKNISRLFACECAYNSIKSSWKNRRRCNSEPDIGYKVDYDDICGPWSFRDNPFHAKQNDEPRPSLCVWKFFNPERIGEIKRCLDDDIVMKHVIAKQLRDGDAFVNENCRDIFVELVCSIIRFARDNRFTEEGTSALVGIFHLTYGFFVSNPWRTVEETHDFFYKTILLHAVENPPKSIEIFTPDECKKSLKFFATLLLGHLPLVRFVCVPNCRLAMTLPKRDEKKN